MVPKCLGCAKPKQTLHSERGCFCQVSPFKYTRVHSGATFGHPLAMPAFSVAYAAAAILSNTFVLNAR
jgi:hypothetical protein